MIRSLLFIVKVFLVVGLFVWLHHLPGHISVTFEAYRADMSMGVFAVFTVIGSLILYSLITIVRYGMTFNQRIRIKRQERRIKDGYRLLTEGMIALVSENIQTATIKANKAKELLPDVPLSHILAAKASEFTKDESTIVKAYTPLILRDDTSFMGYYGLAGHERRMGNLPGALDYTTKALDADPDSLWGLTHLYDVLMRMGQYKQAYDLVPKIIRYTPQITDSYRRSLACLPLYLLGHAAFLRKDRYDTIRYLYAAHEEDPSFVPATVELAAALKAEEKFQKSQKMIEETWEHTPHPDLWAMYIGLNPKATPTERVKMATDLLALASHHPESHLAVVQAAIEAQLWGKARHHLEQAAQLAKGLTARMLGMRATIAEADGSERIHMNQWIKWVVDSASDSSWVCDKCYERYHDWRLVCPNCDHMGSIVWSDRLHGARNDKGNIVTLNYESNPVQDKLPLKQRG